MKRIISRIAGIAAVTLAASALFVSCNGSKAQKTIVETVLQERYGKEAVLDIKSVCIDSTTIKKELEYRKGLLNARLAANEKHLAEFIRDKHNAAANQRKKMIAADHRHIAALDSLDKALEPRWNEIAYRDYAFTGTITTPETKVNVSEAYIRIAGDGRFISMDNKIRGLRQGSGKAIPGYEEIFK